MKYFVNKNIIKILSLSLIVFIGLYHLNSVLFTHSHKLENGNIVVHAHPFNRSDANNQEHSHHHSKEELIYLDIQKNLLIFVNILLILICLNVIHVSLDISYHSFIRTILKAVSDRAPPLMI